MPDPSATPDEEHCFHCGLPVPAGSSWFVQINGTDQPMCCPGCQAVAQAIVAAGLSDFYSHRTEVSPTASEAVPEVLQDMELFDRPELQESFVTVDDEHIREASLILEGIVCAACVWLNEKHVGGLPGVLSFQVNYATHRAQVKWDDSRVHLSDILRAIAAIGYIAHPFDPGRQEEVARRERRQALRRIAVAGLGTMQIMMFAVALYAGGDQGMDADLQNFLRWVSLIVAVPVVLYSAKPFFQSAWRDLKRFQTGMDVPVSLAIGGAFLASAWSTVHGTGEVYFDSVSMFTLFLLTGRYLEMNARHRAGQAMDELVKLLPATTTRVTDAGDVRVPVAELVPGDRVRISPGESVPADGTVQDGTSSVDESLLTGESMPLRKQTGDSLVGGSVNIESPLVMTVEKVGEETVLSAINRLLDRAQSGKPAVARLADRVAGWFVAGLLLLAVGVAWYWWQTDPHRAFTITLSVLVVTCPCALSLATPVALTAATGALTRLGVLTTRGHALETLARATHMIFDKTGTLTEGHLVLDDVRRLGSLTRDRSLAIAAALEQGSEHPLAGPLRNASDTSLVATEVRAEPGSGVEGRIQGNLYRLGRPDFALALSGASIESLPPDVTGAATTVVLGNAQGPVALFTFRDRLREDAATAIEGFRRRGLQVALLSGDTEGAVRQVAGQLRIGEARSRLRPQDKLDYIHALQARGAVVAMTGDGVNDAPVLAGAQVSVAMGSGTQLAAASADMVLLSGRLGHLLLAHAKAGQTLAIIRQNLSWAVVYNMIALPLAAAGWIAPWMAAIGMSSSSLIVVLNSLRLRNVPRNEAG